ncbi:MAG: hypothetical protein IIB05_09180 [Bacteroidetes bacterium]|nr:hypothetical protein [Bacteroidota bacterium]
MDVSEATRQLVSCQFNIDVLGIVGSWQKAIGKRQLAKKRQYYNQDYGRKFS